MKSIPLFRSIWKQEGPKVWVDVKAVADFARGAQQALTKEQSKKKRAKRRKPSGVKGGGAKKRLKKEHP